MSRAPRVWFALDVPSAGEALAWAGRLRGTVHGLKVGLELFVSAGPELVRELKERGWPVFLDLKLHDIPATMGRAAAAAARLGVDLLTAHALAGPEGLEAAVRGARTAAAPGRPPPAVVGVTVLTSLDAAGLERIGIREAPAEAVERLCRICRAAGLAGVVASALEAPGVRASWPGARIVTPGVRPAGADRGDQARVVTPADAVRAGSTDLVVGRPIRDAADPEAAAQAVVREAAEAGSPP